MNDAHAVQFDQLVDLWLDVEEFEARVSLADRTGLQSALALYRGDFLEGFYDNWILGERYRLEALFVEALSRLMAAHEAAGDHHAALTTAQRLLSRDPLREDAHRLVPELQERPAVSQVLNREGAQPLPVTNEPGLDQEQMRLFAGVTCMLAGLSSRTPLLLVLEDLPWAGESTLGLVHHLARPLADHPVLIVGTFRAGAVGGEQPLQTLRRRLARERLARSVRLARLSPEAVRTMIAEMSGAAEAVGPLADRLYHETEGNPC